MRERFIDHNQEELRMKVDQASAMISANIEDLAANKVTGLETNGEWSEETVKQIEGWKNMQKNFKDMVDRLTPKDDSDYDKDYREIVNQRANHQFSERAPAWLAVTLENIHRAEELAANPNSTNTSDRERNYTWSAVDGGNVAVDLHVLDRLEDEEVQQMLELLGVNPEEDSLESNSPEVQAYWENTKLEGKIWGTEHWPDVKQHKENQARDMAQGRQKMYKTGIDGLIVDVSKRGGRTHMAGHYNIKNRFESGIAV